MWSDANNIDGQWDDTSRVRMAKTSTNSISWNQTQPLKECASYNSSTCSISTATPINSNDIPSVAWHPQNSKSLFAWRYEGTGNYPYLRLSVGRYDDFTIQKGKRVYNSATNQPLISGVAPSIACQSTGGLCIFVYTDAHRGNLANYQPWQDINTIRVGHINYNEASDDTGTTNTTYLQNVHSISNSSGEIMKTASKPAVFSYGNRFWIIFRGSHYSQQKLTALTSTDGLNWTVDSTFDSETGNTNYSSTPPSISSYYNGTGMLVYSRY